MSTCDSPTGKYTWEAHAAAGKCWVVYEWVAVGNEGCYWTAVLTVWDTNPPEMSGRSKFSKSPELHTLLKVTSELNGGSLPEDVMEVVVVTMELLE